MATGIHSTGLHGYGAAQLLDWATQLHKVPLQGYTAMGLHSYGVTHLRGYTAKYGLRDLHGLHAWAAQLYMATQL